MRNAVLAGLLVLLSLLSAAPAESGDEGPDRAFRIAHDGGAIWIVFRQQFGSTMQRSTVLVQIVNEGGSAFSLRRKDAWYGVTATGERIPLKLESKAPAEIAPRQHIALTLVASRKTDASLIALGYRSEALAREVEVEEIAVFPQPRMTIPAAYDPEDLPGSKAYSVELSAVVGSDGRVEMIADSPAPAVPGIEPLYESARRALKQWTFAPDASGPSSGRRLFHTTFLFQKDRILRAAFPIAPAEFIPRMRARLHESSLAAVDLPSVDGCATVGYPTTVIRQATNESERVAGAVLVRAAAQAGGTGTWLTVNVIALSQGLAVDGKGVRTDPVVGSRKFIAWLAEALGLPVPATVALSEGTHIVVPGESIEPVERGRWNQNAIEGLMKLSLDAKPDAKTKGHPIDSADPRLPKEAELLAPSDLHEAQAFGRSAVAPPKLIDKVTADYPEAARRFKKEGTVYLTCVIDVQGNVSLIEPSRSPDPSLTAAAIAAVRQWKYEPAMFEGRPVPFQFLVHIQFDLR